MKYIIGVLEEYYSEIYYSTIMYYSGRKFAAFPNSEAIFFALKYAVYIYEWLKYTLKKKKVDYGAVSKRYIRLFSNRKHISSNNVW